MNNIERSKNIGVDFDDVIVSTFRQVLGHYDYIFNGKPLPYNKVTHFGLNKIKGFKRVPTQYCLDLFNNLLAQSSFHQSLEAIKDSLEVCSYLKAQGHNLYIITARPEILQNNTIDWLYQNNASKLFSDVAFLGHQGNSNDRTKLSVCNDLNIEVMIEDAFHNANPFAQNGNTAFMPRRPWNKKHQSGSGIIVVGNNNEDDARQEIKGIYQATH